MFDNMTLPNKNQKLLFQALDEEIIRKYPEVDDISRHIIVARFGDTFDFGNTAIQHKSAAGWQI